MESPLGKDLHVTLFTTAGLEGWRPDTRVSKVQAAWTMVHPDSDPPGTTKNNGL